MYKKQDDNCLELLQKLKQRLDFIETHNNLGYWELDISQKAMFWSPEMYKIFGVKTGHVSSRIFIREHLHHQDIILYKQALSDLLKHNQSTSVILRILQNNKIKYCQFKASVLYRNNQKFIIGSLQNIDYLMQIQYDLLQAKNKAEKLNHEKSFFYAKISHDLRQPLQALKIFVSLLVEEDNVSEQKLLIQKIISSLQNLESLLDNFLEIEKLETGGVIRKDSIFDLYNFLVQIYKEYSITSKDIDIMFSGQHITIKTDALLLERIIRNLLNNAIKYSRGKIQIHSYQCKNLIRIVIKDNGTGLSTEMQHKLFEPYWQKPQHRGMGTGLGLAIVKELSEIIGANIKVKSCEGKGTIFILSLKSNL